MYHLISLERPIFADSSFTHARQLFELKPSGQQRRLVAAMDGSKRPTADLSVAPPDADLQYTQHTTLDFRGGVLYDR